MSNTRGESGLEGVLRYIRELADLGETQRIISEATQRRFEISESIGIGRVRNASDIALSEYKAKSRPNLTPNDSDDLLMGVAGDMIKYLELGTFSGKYSFGKDDAVKKVILWMARYFTGNVGKSSIDTRKGIFMYGAPGSGKSYMMDSLLTFSSERLNFKYPVVPMNEDDLTNTEEYRISGKENRIVLLKVNDELTQFNVSADIYFDDLLRSHHLISKAIKFLYKRFDEFENNRSLTYVTSNAADPNAVRNSVGEQVFSRMQQMFNFIPLNAGVDFRILK